MTAATGEPAGVRPAPASGGWRELAIVIAGCAVLTVVMTWPVAFRLGSVARSDNGDGQYVIWNVAWVARTLVADPLHVFDANIFYPHRWTLVYSESNFGAGVLGVPVYWATRNPYATYNVVFLLSFILSASGTYYLVRSLTRNRGAAAVSAICFAFCPYVFAHTPHVHLMMTAGLPFGMLALHRLADRPRALRGFALGAIMAAQAWFCGYYGVFLALIVGFAILVIATTGHRWTDLRWWTAIAVASVTAIAGALPLFLLYSHLQQSTGFARPLDDARMFAADWQAYLASSAYAHSWMLRVIGHWKEVLFPGFVAVVLGLTGVVVGWRRGGRGREIVVLYAGIAVVTLWASLGPDGGLYKLLHSSLPVFSLMHAPSRFGVAVVLSLSVLAGISVAAMAERVSRPMLASAVVVAVAILEHLTPVNFPPVKPIDPGYHVLARLPYGPVLELPVFSTKFEVLRTEYMLNSTAHWMPLVDAFSSYVPDDFYARQDALAGFPSRAAFKALEPDRVRYAVIHPPMYPPGTLDGLAARLREFAPYLRQRYADDRTWVYEIVGYPD